MVLVLDAGPQQIAAAGEGHQIKLAPSHCRLRATWTSKWDGLG